MPPGSGDLAMGQELGGLWSWSWSWSWSRGGFVQHTVLGAPEINMLMQRVELSHLSPVFFLAERLTGNIPLVEIKGLIYSVPGNT